MAEEKDILQYDLKLNIGEVEAKIQRVQELQAALSAEKLAGEDTSALERQLGAELAGLGKLGEKTQQASGATADLVKNKQALAAVVNLLGGEFGGLISRLANVASLRKTPGEWRPCSSRLRMPCWLSSVSASASFPRRLGRMRSRNTVGGWPTSKMRASG